MRFAAVIFDLDGTLLDSLDDLADSVNAVLASRSLPIHPRDAYRRFVGNGLMTLVRRATPPGLADVEVADLVQAGRAEYGRRWDAKSRPYPEIPAMLDALAAGGVRLALLSNKPDDFTRRIAERFFAPWPLDPARGAMPGVALKPAPDAALAVARDLGLTPGDILFAGDSDVDVQTAKNAGMFAAGVLWGFRDAEELSAAGADKLFASPGDLARFILDY